MITLRWTGWASDFAPYSAMALMGEVMWVPVPGTPTMAGNEWVMTVSVEGSQKYFRLQYSN